MNIITLTLNPAFDIHANIDSIALGHENIASICDYDAGGKGVNISHALTANGVENVCVAVLGDENGKDFLGQIEAWNIPCRVLWIKGRIRENLTFHTKVGAETRISFEGFSADSGLLHRVRDEISDILGEGDIVTFTGRLPKGVGVDEAKSFLLDLKDMGARLVIDSRSFSLDDLIELRPWLIKPNEEEISEYVGKEIKGSAEAATEAERLHTLGIDNVMISLGSVGAVLACSDGVFFAGAPKIEAISTVGAGDSSIAGFLSAHALGLPSDIALSRAVAYGSAACIREGTAPPLPKDIERLFATVRTDRLSV